MAHKKMPKNKDPHKAREARKYARPVASREYLLELIRDHGAPVTYERLIERLGLKHEDDLEAIRRRLIAMVRDGQLVRNRKNGYLPVDDENLIRGRVSGHADGYGFLIPDEGGGDLFLSARQMRCVLHGDIAVARVTGIDRKGRREGRIVEAVERAHSSLVGRFYSDQGVGFVEPDNTRITQDIAIPAGNFSGAVSGQMVVVRITHQPTFHQPAMGVIEQVLGDHMQPGMEIEVAVNNYGIPATWSDAVLEESAAMPDEVAERDKTDRVDLRKMPLVTIDGEDARDFDDAVFCEQRKTGWRLFVAIADVSHYVTPDSPLDKEAKKRGTSVYFPGEVVPMLPEKLSNGLCSINPDVDRLCMVCEISVGFDGKLTRSRFFEAVMRSHARLTYTEVAGMLDGSDAAAVKRHGALLSHLRTLDALYAVLREKRAERGAIEFESTETQFLFDEHRKIESIVPVIRNRAHLIIEECMILANIAAARFLERHRVAGLFRVHEKPNSDKLEDLRSVLAERGIWLGGGDEPTAKDYAEVLAGIDDRDDVINIQRLLLRSLSQAVYTPSNKGHFGLALEKYAHFTSPIRRYPDLLVHRAIRHVIRGGKGKGYGISHDEMVLLGQSCSSCERRADEATWDVIAWLKCEYMLDKVGQAFNGKVSAVTSFGLFVELDEIHVEGLIHITALPKDYYQFDPASIKLVGERSGRTFQTGDALEVRLVRVDLDERKIDLEMAHAEKVRGSKRKRKKKK